MQFGPWILVGSSMSFETKARWRHPISRYDIRDDVMRSRPGAWWGENGPIDFQPEWWREMA